MKEALKGRNTISVTKKRLGIIAVAFLLFLSYLFINLFKLQILSNQYYKDKVYDQITTSSALKAERGNIYDSNMNLLATNKTVWRVFISTRDIKLYEKESGTEYSKLIASGLSQILSLNYSSLLEKITKSNVLDVTIKKEVEEDEYKEVLEFVRNNGLENLVFTESSTSRYYPESTLAAHVLGFTGSDNQGLYGLEYFYEKELSGSDGYYLYGKDANGNALPTEYSSFVPASDGNSLVTTIDPYIQRELEAQLELIRATHGVTNRVCGIVMDTTTGAILSMATSSPFDPNEPYTLDSTSYQKLLSSGYAEGSEEYSKLKKELLEVMWSNKAVSEIYEPGSTFKIITVASSLDAGVVNINNRYSCRGFHLVGGWRIKCHKTTGHGSNFTLAYGLQMSCNPTMMQVSEKLGAESFYSYIEDFGYFEKSGIDLPSEGSTVFHKPENIGPTELATISFGQRFKVSIINHLSAVSAIANGGNLVTPYVVEKIIDPSGNTVYQHQAEVKRSVVSKEVADTVKKVLEDGVSQGMGAKNAGVNGYTIGAKTGTSEKFDVLDANGNSYLRIGSTVAFASNGDDGIAVIIVVDEPQGYVKYGSVVAAPYISTLLSNVLPYLSYECSVESTEISVDDYTGKGVSDAASKLKSLGIDYTIVGDGEKVLSQSPMAGDVITKENGKITLYTEKALEKYVQVPNLSGLTLSEANKTLINSGLNVKINGNVYNGAYGELKVVGQSIQSGIAVLKGTVIEINVIYFNFVVYKSSFASFFIITNPIERPKLIIKNLKI